MHKNQATTTAEATCRHVEVLTFTSSTRTLTSRQTHRQTHTSTRTHLRTGTAEMYCLLLGAKNCTTFSPTDFWKIREKSTQNVEKAKENSQLSSAQFSSALPLRRLWMTCDMKTIFPLCITKARATLTNWIHITLARRVDNLTVALSPLYFFLFLALSLPLFPLYFSLFPHLPPPFLFQSFSRIYFRLGLVAQSWAVNWRRATLRCLAAKLMAKK